MGCGASSPAKKTGGEIFLAALAGMLATDSESFCPAGVREAK
jgi:hypothetical protein